MANSGQLVKLEQTSSNPRILLALDDNALMKRIQATHGPENHEIKVKPLLKMIEMIVDLSDGAPGEFHESDFKVEALSDQNLGDMREHLANKINSISIEILGNCSGGQDVQEKIFAVFSAVSGFSWDAKGIIALAAFAVNYGEFWLVAQLCSVHDVAKSLALLEQIPDMDHDEFSRLKSNLNTLTRALLVLIKCICEFKDLKSEEKNIKPDAPEILEVETQIPTAIYWTIKSIVICQSQLIKLTGLGYEYLASNAEAWELSPLTCKIIQLHGHLKRQLDLCYQRAEENRVKQVYQKIVNLFKATHNDNTEILKALVGSQDDTLYNGQTKTAVSANLLGKKTVVLYISGLKLSFAELSFLKKMYSSYFQQKNESDGDYDIVWLPIVDKSSPWDETNKKEFEAARDAMPWFSLRQPSLLDVAVIEYIKNDLHFEKRSIMVTLNPEGKVVNFNAMYMILIWGSDAFPFSRSRERELWEAETWRLELLVHSIEPPIAKWIADGKFIYLYGGEDMEWIRKFTITAKSVFQNGKIPMEMVYMGTSNPKDKVEKINAAINAENISHTVADINQMWLFWHRLECIWLSRVQQGMSPETDAIMKEIFLLRSFECSERGWAIICKSDQMAKGMGDTLLQRLSVFDNWKSQAEKKGFVTALNEQLHQIYTPESCNKLVLPATTSGIPRKMFCFECGRVMEELTTFSCCGDKPEY